MEKNCTFEGLKISKCIKLIEIINEYQFFFKITLQKMKFPFVYNLIGLSTVQWKDSWFRSSTSWMECI